MGSSSLPAAGRNVHLSPLCMQRKLHNSTCGNAACQIFHWQTLEESLQIGSLLLRTLFKWMTFDFGNVWFIFLRNGSFCYQYREDEYKGKEKSCIYCDLGNTELNKFHKHFDFSDKSRNQHWHKQLVSKLGGAGGVKQTRVSRYLSFHHNNCHQWQ